jgi:hypothetical protein
LHAEDRRREGVRDGEPYHHHRSRLTAGAEQGEGGHISDLVVWMISCIDDLGSGWLKEEDKDV